MSSALLPDPSIAADPPADVTVASAAPGPIPREVARHVISSTATLGLGVMLERGAGFAANILAARFAGASTFGAYSLGISTANNISTYAAGGIGATAARFSGKYPYRSAGYPTLARVLAIVSTVSAVLAAVALWLGAAPIAALLHKASLTGLLRWASISAAGMILLECARGFFVGQRRLAALLLLSVVVGVGMITLLPITAAMHRPTRMIVAQGAITLAAVSVCLLLARPLGLHAAPTAAAALPMAPMLREVWTFGFVQLAGLVSANLAGWWLTALVARSDTTLVQMSFFAIASQLRNLVGLAPGLLTEGSYAVMAASDDGHPRTPHQVMALCTFASTTVALLLASVGIVLVPWGLRLLYGASYGAAATTAAAGLAIAVVHMGNAPASARLTIVSIRASGVINTVWALFVAITATLFLFHGGSAVQGMAILFAGHVVASALVLAVLSRKDRLPAGMVQLFLVSTGAILALAGLSLLRESRSAHAISTTAAMTAVLVGSLSVLFLQGRRRGWLPSAALVQKAVRSLTSAAVRIIRRGEDRTLHGA